MKFRLKYLVYILVFSAVIGSYLYFKPKHRMLLITGCARSGTRYVAKALTNNGYPIGHQRIKSNGMSSWDLASNPKKGRWKRYSLKEYKFDHIFHQVRNPLKVISSVYFTEDRTSWNYILSQLPEISIRDSHLTKCAKYWYYWNLKAEGLAEWTYRLEDLDKLWEEFERRLGNVKIDRNLVAQVPKNENSAGAGVAKQFAWEDLEKELDPKLYSNMRNLAKKYGYN